MLRCQRTPSKGGRGHTRLSCRLVYGGTGAAWVDLTLSLALQRVFTCEVLLRPISGFIWICNSGDTWAKALKKYSGILVSSALV